MVHLRGPTVSSGAASSGAQAAFEQLSRRYESILNATGEGLLGLDTEGRVTFANPAAARILGLPASELIGKKAHETFHHTRPDGSPFPAEACPSLKVISDGVLQTENEILLWRADGISFWADCVSAPIIEKNQVTGAVLVFNDVTERRRLALVLRQGDKMSGIGQLAAGVAHELNNPLHAILAFAQSLLQQVPESDVTAGPLKHIEHEALRCATLVSHLLAFSRRRSPGVHTENLGHIAEEVLSLVEAQAHTKNITVVREMSLDLPPMKLDRSQISQVLVNLCANAMDAMPNGGTLTVGVGTLIHSLPGPSGQPFAVLRVADTGPGIPPAIRDRIFEPFFTTKETGQGAGLGLSLAYEFVKNHDGTLTVFSEVGRGSLFQAYLPIQT